MILQKPHATTRLASASLADASRELAATIARHLPVNGEHSPHPSIHLGRTSKPTRPMHVLYEPAFVVVAQGKKLVTLGREELAYDETSYFLSSVALPITGRVAKASPAAPYLSVMIPLTPALIGPVLANAALPGSERGQGAAAKGVDVRALDLPLLDAVLRLVRLIDTPEHAPVLAPLVLHEIVYRLLVG